MAQAKTSKGAAPKTPATPKRPAASKAPKVAAVKRGMPLAHGVGRRKSAVARVWLRRGTGSIVVNGRDYREYFNTDIARLDAATPYRILPTAANYSIEANVRGGGAHAQAGAVCLGIARALVANDETARPTLREFGLLTVDARRKERKKYGQKAARRKFQFVKR